MEHVHSIHSGNMRRQYSRNLSEGKIRSQTSVSQYGSRYVRRRVHKPFADQPKEPTARIIRRFRWRMLTRVILHLLKWEQLRNSGKDRGFVMRRMVAGRVQERVFNVEHFSKIVQQHQILTTHAKLLLYKEPEQRSAQDIVIILGHFNRMTCFNKYSVFTKRQLAGKVRYNCHAKGDVIFTEGAAPLSFYLLLSGSLQMYTNAPDDEGGPLKPVGGPIKEGSSFGELGIMNSDPRMATVVCAEHSEMFSLDKVDFVKLLLGYHDEERTMKSTFIRGIPEIAGVPEADIKRAIDTSYIRTFVKGEIIINGEDHNISRKNSQDLGPNGPGISLLDTFAHIIVSGSAVLEKRIRVVQQALPCGTTVVNLAEDKKNVYMKTASRESNEDDGILNFVTDKVRQITVTKNHSPALWWQTKNKYLSVQTYIPGDVFCAVLCETEYIIGAKEATTVLYMPKTPFMLHKSGEHMVRLFDDLSTNKITVAKLLREYNSTRIWRDYRKQLVRKVLLDKSLRNSQFL